MTTLAMEVQYLFASSLRLAVPAMPLQLMNRLRRKNKTQTILKLSFSTERKELLSWACPMDGILVCHTSVEDVI
jgi:hypothetical protein